MADGLRERLVLIPAADEVKPSWIVFHDLPLDHPPEAYENVDAREEGWTKVVLHPGQSA
jgi:glutathione-independent formaldehyde dehydrogenase